MACQMRSMLAALELLKARIQSEPSQAHAHCLAEVAALEARIDATLRTLRMMWTNTR